MDIALPSRRGPSRPEIDSPLIASMPAELDDGRDDLSRRHTIPAYTMQTRTGVQYTTPAFPQGTFDTAADKAA